MRPLVLVAAGVAVVVVDLRVTSPDLAADPVGWLLVAEGCRRLGARVPALAALAAAALSVNEALLPSHWQIIDRATGEDLPTGIGEGTTYPQDLRFDELTDGRLALFVAGTVVALAALGLLLGHLLRRVRREQPADVRVLAALAGAVVVWLGPPLVASTVALIGGDGYDPVWNGAAEKLAVLSTLAGLAAVGLLWRVGDDRSWAQRPKPVRTAA